jgi:predicted dehydrogenase
MKLKRKLYVSIVGLGVGERHLNFLKKNKNIEIVSIFDPDVKKLKKISKKYNVKSVNYFKKVTLEKKTNLVVVASPDHFHTRQIVDCLKTKKNIFIEKPICNNLSDLNLIIRQWKKNKNTSKIRSNLILRTAPLFLWLKRKIDSNYFGRIYSIDAEYLYGRLSKFLNGWRGKTPNYSPMSGGGVHMIDLVCWLIQELPTEVFSESSNICSKKYQKKYKLKSNDFISSNFKFKSGILSRITANLGCAFKHQHTIKIYGSKKTFVYDDLGPRIYSGNDRKFKCTKLKIKTLPRNKTDVLKQFTTSIMTNTYNSKFALNDLRITNVLCYAILSAIKLIKLKIKYII